MSESNDKNYNPYKIPKRGLSDENNLLFSVPPNKNNQGNYFEKQKFAEIDIENDIPVSHKAIPITKPDGYVLDEKRGIFESMREILRKNHSSYFINSRFYDKQVQYEKSKVFYFQAVFMKDFEDDYDKIVPFSAYFPYYQMMSYEQLRTYFTWRTGVRKGEVRSTSLSYAFIYIYELLNNIGVENAEDGLDKLMFFRNFYKMHDNKIEKYLKRWVRDYYVYYQFSKPFTEFVSEHNLSDDYPDVTRTETIDIDRFETYSAVSKYNICQSVFYVKETEKLIRNCFEYVITRLDKTFEKSGINLNELIFCPSKCQTVWTPFSGALFYPVLKQPDIRTALSENEIYICEKNRWYLSSIITLESGRHLVGYIFKQMESVLRKLTDYRYSLYANMGSVGGEVAQKILRTGISLEKEITDAVEDFYTEENRVVVAVDESSLSKIRQEAQITQENLIVPDSDGQTVSDLKYDEISTESPADIPVSEKNDDFDEESDCWTCFKNSLNITEKEALATVISGGDFKYFADKKGIMAEVLADIINEKAADIIGDNILDYSDEAVIFDEYIEKVEFLVE
ncbi:MAG: TerB N-terminal domain-containing protein [Eubacteriales bacterium]|nr:TerB N-terminal domain-containing protein [Eubacteriales bacterium]MDD4422792.1 TerB N-terminal domain-containing protein [Eubacteriales bacterium]